ncbi:MAG TPA: nuclear transport factor 2 family protein [Vicinamibacterales bacterium]|nr:nuclear transport factor 2 family protein [Vicinamibacterales bacterium]
MSKLISMMLVLVFAGASAFAQAPASTVAGRLDALEAREAIRALWAEYGRTLDARDFVAFSRLFARNAEFGSGPGAAKGPAAIGAFLEKAIGTNYPDSKGKNFHLYFNESIDVRGDHATAVSKGGYVMATPDNSKADVLLLAEYRDELVKEDGQWKFLKRVIVGEIPVPRRATQ